MDTELATAINDALYLFLDNVYYIIVHRKDVEWNKQLREDLAATETAIMLPSLLASDQAASNWRRTLLLAEPLVYTVAAVTEALVLWAEGGELSQNLVRYMNQVCDSLARRACIGHHTRLTHVFHGGACSGSRQCARSFQSERVLSLRTPVFVLNGKCAYCNANDGDKLMRCAGGCGGLAQYWCKEHQRAHWKEHKNCCRANKK